MKKIYSRLMRQLTKAKTPPVVSAVIADSLTYIDEEALSELYRTIESIEAEKKQGILIEAGCALGGSAIVITSAKSPLRPFYVYDVFGMIPQPSELDGEDVHTRYAIIKDGKSSGIGGDKYYGYEQNLYAKVIENFERHGVNIASNTVTLVKGLFEDSLCVDTPVALAHLDGDWYASVMTCLERIEPYLIPGGVLVIDDYDAWSGCRKAVDDYFRDKKDKYDFVRKVRLNIIKKNRA